MHDEPSARNHSPILWECCGEMDKLACGRICGGAPPRLKKNDKRCGCDDDGHGNDGRGSGTAEAWCQFGEDNNNSAWHAAWFSSFHQLTPRGTPSWTPRLQIEADLSRSRLLLLQRGLACARSCEIDWQALPPHTTPRTPMVAHMISPLLIAVASSLNAC